MSTLREFLGAHLRAQLPAESWSWLERTGAELAHGADTARFCALISLASRFVPRGGGGEWSAAERTRAAGMLEGWNPERWTKLESARAWLVLSRGDLATPAAVAALEEAFRYADVGELCALYKTLAHLPDPKRFVWRAGEGCRSSMRAVFEAAACDTPLPVKHFDDNAWRQLVIKAVFVEAPLWRVFGLDTRLDGELARMALDLVEERRSAGRPVRHELWLALGKHGGARAIESLEQELAGENRAGRQAAALALARAGETQRLARWLERERDPAVRATMEQALAGRAEQGAFAAIAV